MVLGIVPHQSFLGILCKVVFSYSEKLADLICKTKLTHFLGNFRKMASESDNVVVTEFAQVAPPAVARVPAMPTAVPISVSPGEKPEKFIGLNFKRWQQKMLFYLTTLNLARFLTEDAPKLKEDEHDIQVISVVDAWKHSDFLCRNYVMNGLADSLYNVYSDKKTAKEL